MDAVPALLSYVDADCRYRLANSAYSRWFGRTPAQIDGRPVWEVLGEADWQAVRPYVERALAGEPVTYEEELPDTLVGPRWVRVSYTPDRDGAGRVRGVVVLVNDLTERKHAENAQRETEFMLAQAQRMAHLGSWELDLGRLDDLNRNRLRWTAESYRILGFEPGSVEVTNELFFSVVHPQDRHAVQAAVAQALRDRQPYEIEHRVCRPDGTERIVHEWAMIETDASGRPRRMLGTCQDVTEQRRAEAALLESDRRKDEFLALLAHELRNPLAPLRSGLAILALPQVPQSVQERTRTIMTRQLEHVVRLVDDLLDVARIARGQLELRLQRVSLQAVIAHALETARPAIEAAGQQLHVSLPAQPVEVQADLVRLAQAIANLLQNASRYTGAGGRIDVALQAIQSRAVVRVRDTGMGIAPEVLPHVFTLFFRADRTSSGRDGLGIGLALVKSIVELHDGRIEAHSPGLGAGSEFAMRLPLTCPASTEPTVQSAAATAAELPPKQVLIVDDNADAAESLAALLSLQGHETRVAHDGATALALAQCDPPDVVFLDLGMPGMDGYEVARQLRRSAATRASALIALTGWGQEQDRRRTAEAGFDRHVVKPIAPQALRDLLAELS